jgi:predicted lipid carrier protein YhbT
MNSIAEDKYPELPALARIPLKFAPGKLKSFVISRALNTLFATPLAEDELEFLDGRRMNVCISDAGLSFSVTLENGRLQAHHAVNDPDLSIEGLTYTFLLLGTRREDSDTLFFRRQLKTQGDTELGLYLKNFLDGLEPETLPLHRILDPLMQKSLTLADRYQRLRNRFAR